MNEHFQSLYKNSIEQYASIFVPESIEATSLYKAYELAASGNSAVAEQIIQHLLIPEDVRADIVRSLYAPNTPTPSNSPVPTPIPAPIPVPTQRPTPAPLPPPPAPPQSVDETMAIPRPPVPPTSTQMPIPIPPTPPATPVSATLIPRIDKEEDMPIGMPEKNILKEQEDTLNTILKDVVIPIDSDSHTARISDNRNTLEEIIQEKQTTLDTDQMAGAYNKVFKSPLTNSQYDVPSVIKTYEEAADVSEKKQAQQDLIVQKKIEKAKTMFARAEDYLRKSYASGSDTLIASAERQLVNLKNQYPEYVAQFASHIHTLENIKYTVSKPEPVFEEREPVLDIPDKMPEIQTSDEKIEIPIRESNVVIEEVNNKYAVPGARPLQPVIPRAKQEEPKIFETQKDTVVETPSFAQEQEVQKQTEETEVVVTPQPKIETKVESPAEGVDAMPTLLEVVTLAGMEIHPGMRITGEQDVYTVARIEKYGDYTRVVFEGDISDSMYSVPTPDLESALQIEDLHPDTFFAPFAE